MLLQLRSFRSLKYAGEAPSLRDRKSGAGCFRSAVQGPGRLVRAAVPAPREPAPGPDPLRTARGERGSSPAMTWRVRGWPMYLSIRVSWSVSRDDAKEIAIPVAPALPVRPMRWT